jgi:hypothetical protein
MGLKCKGILQSWTLKNFVSALCYSEIVRLAL